MVTRIIAKQVVREATRKVAASAGPVARRAGKTARVVREHAARAAGGMLGLAGERMTKVDTAWLRMDSPSNLMMIIGVWTLEPGIKYQALCVRVQERLLQYNRFRQRVQEDAAGAS